MEKMNWNAASVRMAAASIVSALVAAGVVWMWTGVYLPGAGLSISLLLVLLAGLLAGGRSPRGTREWLLVAVCVLEDLTFFFFMSTSLRLVNLPVAAGLTALTLFSLNGRLNHGAAEAGALGETLRILPRACVRYIPVPFRALPRARLSTGIVVGLIISVPVLAVAMLLLCSADAVFEGMFTGLVNRLYEADAWALLVKPLLFLLLGLIAFSFLYAQKALERLPEREAKPPFPTGALATPMLLLCALYALFAAVQFIYLFGGREAAAMRGGYAQYARNGFFELVVICALNLLLAGLAVRRSGGARVVRAAAVGMYAFTAVMLASSAWRMSLYTARFGLSFLRLITYWGIFAMAAVTLAAAWHAVRPETRTWSAAFAVIVASWLLFAYANPEGVIAAYNVRRAGAKVDVEYLSGLSPDALAALKPLAKENAWAGVAANRIGDGYRDISAYEWSLTCRLLPEPAAEPIPEGESPSVGDE